MASDKTERLLNLHIMLLVARRHVAKQDIRRALYPGYPDTRAGTEAFEKAFERDKEDLRDLGVVIDVASLDSYFEDEVGYRIPSDESALPEIRFEADEAAVLGLAARAWEQATVAKSTTEALRKLAAQGVEVDEDRLDVVAPRISAEEPTFDAFWEATQRRREVRFDYRRTAAAEPVTRRLQPWGVVRSSGRWYVVGFDVDRQQERVFRLSRVLGPVRASGRSGAYDVPEGTDVRRVADRLVPQGTPIEATLLVRHRSGVGLRRTATRIEADVAGPDDASGWDRLSVRGDGQSLAEEVLAHGPHVVVEEPAELRESVVSRLRGVVGPSEVAS